jgi:hypothetical protein
MVVMDGPVPRPSGRAPRRRRAVWAGVLLVGVLLLAGVLTFLLRDPRKSLDVRSGFPPDVYLTDDPASIRDTTSEVCPRIAYCVQAAESPRIRIMRFSSEDAARAEAVRLAPDAWPSDWFVVEFLEPDSMTQDDYQLVESMVDGAAADSPD